jgi:hypothetical protein
MPSHPMESSDTFQIGQQIAKLLRSSAQGLR